MKQSIHAPLVWLGLAAAGAGACADMPGLTQLPSADVSVIDSRAAAAAREYEGAMWLQPDIDNGRRVYLTCAVCHLPEGWGTVDGSYPQIAGQLGSVVIKQLADFRAGNRNNPLMYPFSVPGILGGLQEIADVSAYVERLPMTPFNGVGPGDDLASGEQIYADNCAKCHGSVGQGNADRHIPAIAAQHYQYLMRQFDRIRTGERQNADAEMVKQIKGFTAEQTSAVLDYTARLRPPEDKLATAGWTNPDFPGHVRDAMGVADNPPSPDGPAPDPGVVTPTRTR